MTPRERTLALLAGKLPIPWRQRALFCELVDVWLHIAGLCLAERLSAGRDTLRADTSPPTPGPRPKAIRAARKTGVGRGVGPGSARGNEGYSPSFHAPAAETRPRLNAATPRRGARLNASPNSRASQRKTRTEAV
jgi:hypothetical protein